MEKSEDDSDINRIHQTQQHSRMDQQSKSTLGNEGKPKQFESNKKCYFCGRDFHKHSSCPARNATCHKCGKSGHFKSVCQSSSVVHEVTEDKHSSAFLGAIHDSSIDVKNWTVNAY